MAVYIVKNVKEINRGFAVDLELWNLAASIYRWYLYYFRKSSRPSILYGIYVGRTRLTLIQFFLCFKSPYNWILDINFRLMHPRDLEINVLDRQTDGQQSDPIRGPFLYFRYGTLKAPRTKSIENVTWKFLRISRIQDNKGFRWYLLKT